MMVRHYSHEAADLQPALEMLSSQNTEDHRVCSYKVVTKLSAFSIVLYRNFVLSKYCVVIPCNSIT